MNDLQEHENFIHNKFGYCYYGIDELKDMAIIFNLYVEPEYRCKGHATNLIRFVMNEIRKAGYTKEIKIMAEPQEDSISIENLIAFYEKMGLKVIQRQNGEV